MLIMTLNPAAPPAAKAFAPLFSAIVQLFPFECLALDHNPDL